MSEVPVAVSVSDQDGTGFQLVPFDYYTQQGDDSATQGVNCGPASVAMAIKYGSALGITPTPHHIRTMYMGLGPSNSRYLKFTGPDDFNRALDFIGADHQKVSGAAGVWDAVHRYHTVIVPAKMGDIGRGQDVKLAANGECPAGKKLYHYDDKVYCYTNTKDIFLGKYKDWDDDNGKSDKHIVLVNGVYTDSIGQKYFYVYDPDVFGTSGEKYFYFGDENLPKGMYRIWKYEELDAALRHNTNRAVEVEHNPAHPIPYHVATTRQPNASSLLAETVDERIEFIEHASYPDGSMLSPGQVILKAWLVRNSGQSDFGLRYRLVQTGGPQVQLYGEAEIGQILMGETATVFAYIQAPSQQDNYATTYQVVDSSGKSVQGTLTFNFTVSGQHPYGYDEATFVDDVTVRDGTVVSPGQSLHKVWRLRNSGSSTWDAGYQLAFVSGDQMGAPSSVGLPRSVAPGETIDIGVNITAPSADGTYQGNWRMRNPDGTYFGDLVWVRIEVGTHSDNIVLTADPPSPASADQVRIYARVDDFPNLRALRILVDGEQLCELGAPEIQDCVWHTSGYSPGQHSISAEADDSTGPAWDNPERRTILYEYTGSGVVNHAPYRPTLVANPAYDWYVTIGDAPQLCAQEQGDPDGDSVNEYRFVATASVGTVDSGWVRSSCHSFGSITPGTYEWHTQVRDSQGGVSDWSDSWHFTTEPTGIDAYIDHFSPGSPSDAEEVKIYGCTSGHAGVNITMRVLVNDATDGTDAGEWHIIKEQGSPCFNDEDAPVWRTLEYGDGPHLVRLAAWAIEPDAGDIYDTVYTLNHRRPASPRLVAPVPPSGILSEAVYLNSRTLTFKWAPTIRADTYTLHISADPSPSSDPNPVFRQTFDSGVTEHTVTFDQDYATLHWQVEAANDVSSNFSGVQLFDIDRQNPACTISDLASPSYESVFQVNWSGTDNLAGIRSFDIQFMDSARGTWEDWLTTILSDKTYDLFTGQPGHTYYFRCRATDNAANTGDYPSSADTSMTVDPAARPPTPWWDSAYAEKRNITILNNMPSTAMAVGYPVHLHYDSNTTPTAEELYNASLSTPKCKDLRIVTSDATELDRVVQNCSSTAIDIWFRSQVGIPGGASDNTSHQLYYGNASADAPPADPNEVWYPYREADTTYLYFLQEGGGSIAYDSSGNGRNCSIDPSVQWSSSKFGRGLRFNRANYGDSRSLNCGAAIPLSAFTIEFWYKPDADDGGRIAGELAGGGNGGGGNNWFLQNFEGRIRLDTWECPTCGSQEVRSDFNLRDAPYVGRWNHIAVTFNGGNQVRFYINGALDSTKYLSEGGINTFTPPLEIGSAEGGGQIKANLGAFRISSGVKTSFPYGSFAAITNEPTTAVGQVISPSPTGSADLAILSLSTYPNPSGGVIVEAVVQNQGDLNTLSGFYTDLYLDHLPTGAGDYVGSIRFWINDPIASGETTTLATLIDDLSSLSESDQAATASLANLDSVNVQTMGTFTETSGTLYAQTDSMGLVSEQDDHNNIYTSGTPICTASSDSFEDDESYTAATPISVGGSQTHNFSAPGDQDWVKFDAEAGRSYLLTTGNLDLSSDTYLYLYDTDGTTLLASGDDSGGSLASEIEWTAPTSGTYYAVVRHWNPGVGGCGTRYDVSVDLGHLFRQYLPVALRTSTGNHPPDRPRLPSPTDGALNQPISLILGWQAGDPDGDSMTYDVYFEAGDSTPDALMCDDATSPSCDPGTLGEGTHYYWQVIARDEHRATRAGPIWSFTTGGNPGLGIWQFVASPAEPFLTGVSMVSADDGWAVGDAGTIIHWDGAAWQVASSPTTSNLEAVHMLSANDGWAVGWDGKIARWNGSSWQNVTSPTTMTLRSVFMVSTSDGWIVGGNTPDSVILHWNGVEWSMVPSPAIDPAILIDVDMVSATDGWAVGNFGRILRWNGGSWQLVDSPTSLYIISVDMVSSTDGWAVGGEYPDGEVYRWNGTLWQTYSSPPSNELEEVSMVSSTDGWAVSWYGNELLHWDGVSWTKSSSPIRARGVDMLSSTQGWAVGVGIMRYVPSSGSSR